MRYSLLKPPTSMAQSFMFGSLKYDASSADYVQGGRLRDYIRSAQVFSMRRKKKSPPINKAKIVITETSVIGPGAGLPYIVQRKPSTTPDIGLIPSTIRRQCVFTMLAG